MFITLEGGEGSGKSTLMRRIAAALVAEGTTVTTTREPGGCHLAETIRGWLLDNGNRDTIGPDAEMLLFLAARAQHIQEVIAPALARGETVLCDRFNDSTIAYQGYGRDLGPERVETLCGLASKGLAPTLTLYLDVPPEIGLKRAARLGPADRMEEEALAFHQRVRHGFQALAAAHPERIHTLDATDTADEVFDAAISEVLSHAK